MALSEEQEKIQKKRISNFESPKTEIDVREAFSNFWSLEKRHYKKYKEMEDVLWAHLKASGFDKPDLFSEGIKHFGLKK